MTIEERFLKQLQALGIESSDRLIVAVSGGMDSMALLHLFCSVNIEQRPELHVVHIQHQLRETDAIDAELVETFCKEHHLSFQLVQWDKSLHSHTNVEAEARAFRYQVFRQSMKEQQARFVLTAHHADDQLETVLMRLIRGSTLEGIGGIQPIRSFGEGWLVRPLLSFEKVELQSYCQNHQVPYVEDETNASSSFTRNRIRNQIVPLLKEENPRVAQHANEFRDDLSDVQEVAEFALQNAIMRCYDEDKKSLRVPAFQSENPTTQRLIAKWYLETISHTDDIAYQRVHRDALVELLLGEKPQASIEVRGGQFVRSYNQVTFQKRTISPQTVRNKWILNENEWFDVQNNGKIGMFLLETLDLLEKKFAEYYVLNQTTLVLPLSVRTFQTGDRMTIGLEKPFTKRLSRIFIDKKIPNEVRHTTPVVVDAKGTVVWVPGIQTSSYLQPIQSIPFDNRSTNERQYILGRKSNEVQP